MVRAFGSVIAAENSFVVDGCVWAGGAGAYMAFSLGSRLAWTDRRCLFIILLSKRLMYLL